MNSRIIVVGGGISGLVAAHRLGELARNRNLDLEILLLEAAGRLGGVISTERVNDFIVEAGPDSFITEKPWALELCERLGIGSRLISTNPSHQNVYIIKRGKLYPLPQGFFLLAPTRLWPLIRTPLFSWRGKLRIACEPFIGGPGSSGDESLASFARRRFGQELLERVAQPLVAGIYGADPEKLSLAATMPRFLEMERAKGSVILAMRAEARRRAHVQRVGSGARWGLFVTLRDGMQGLVDAIAGRLPAGVVELGTRVTGLARDVDQRSWTVKVESGRTFPAAGIVLAVPAYATADLLSPLSPELAGELKTIPYSSMATVSLAYREEDIPRPLDAFGLVAPAVEARGIVACTFSSVKYEGRAPAGHVLLRVFVGGALKPGLWDQDDHSLKATVRKELAALLGIKAEPLLCRIHRHPSSMPQYQVGHLERVRRIESHLDGLPGLQLAGNAYRGVGIADCVHSGEEAAEKSLERLQ